MNKGKTEQNILRMVKRLVTEKMWRSLKYKSLDSIHTSSDRVFQCTIRYINLRFTENKVHDTYLRPGRDKVGLEAIGVY
jgi:hypothetical protein